MYISPMFFKHGFGVASPGDTEPGVKTATALGLVCGDYQQGLQVLSPMTQEDVRKAKRMVEDGKIEVICDWTKENLYVRAEVTTANETVQAVVSGMHDTIVSVIYNGQEIFRADEPKNAAGIDISDLDPDMILEYIRNVDVDALRFMLDGAKMNMALAKEGLKKEYGLHLGRTLLKRSFCDRKIPDDLF